jgi:hypothetical protein
MRILFYLPVVTPWWFDHVVSGLIWELSAEAEIHVMVPPLWRGTGIGPEQLHALAGCENVARHILDGDDHPALRSSAAGCPDLFELVNEIDSDLTLCRSCDIDRPRRFPGIVKFIMEAGFPPFPAGDEWVVLRDHPFDHGIMPDLGAAARARLADAFAPAWSARHGQFGADSRADMLEQLGLPRDRAVIALPLEYEHEENFFGIHSRIRNGADLVPAVAEALGDDVLLAVTDHPLNSKYCDRTGLHDAIARLGDRAVLIDANSQRVRPTFDLARACGGMIFDNSKTISVAAFFGTPILRSSEWQTGGWLNAAGDLAGFAKAVRDGTAAAPDDEGTRAWFGFHVANNVLNLAHPEVNGRLILDMVETPVDPGRWDAGLSRYADAFPELFQ